MKTKSGLTRRQILAMTGAIPAGSLLFNPVKHIIESILHGIVYNAQASTAPNSLPPRRYVYLNFPGAPPRWYFDLPLNPYTDGGELNQNPFVNTRFDGAGKPIYATVPMSVGGTTINMPHLWSCDIPTADGSWVPMSRLMEHMMIIRGIDMLQDGHSQNRIRMLNPSTSAASLPGAVADRSEAVIPAVMLPFMDLSTYRSGRGIGLSRIVYNNTSPLQQLLDPFVRATNEVPTNWLSRRQAMEDVIQGALSTICTYAEATRTGSDAVCFDRKRAEKLLREGVGDISTVYTALKNKYDNLIRSCLSLDHPILGVTDKKITWTNPNEALVCVDGGLATPVENEDLRTILDPALTTVDRMSDVFAVVEYVLTKGLSSTVVAGFGSTLKMNYINIKNITQNDTTDVSARNTWIADEHSSSPATSIIANSFRFRALAACIYELTQALTSAGLFDETVIQFGAEFNRSPRRSKTGADHGFQGNVTSVFSGAIKTPCVLGNIKQSTIATWPGHWGWAGPGKIDGAQVNIGVGHVTSTIAQLLRVEHPMKNNMSLVMEGNSGTTPTTDLAKNL